MISARSVLSLATLMDISFSVRVTDILSSRPRLVSAAVLKAITVHSVSVQWELREISKLTEYFGPNTGSVASKLSSPKLPESPGSQFLDFTMIVHFLTSLSHEQLRVINDRSHQHF